MNGLFFATAINVVALVLTVLLNKEFHEVAGVMALTVASLGWFTAALAMHDMKKLTDSLSEAVKLKITGDDNDRKAE